MNKITETVGGLRTFLEEVGMELKKCSWPTKKELMGSAAVVVIAVTILGVYVGMCDAVNTALSRLFFR
ncbi:MAG: preprotein translocase subunit SecE [Kiritimatiellales bacterium]|nr:preprotein translocase subunit SecE [Kiritimatiellales bacterium]